MRVAVWGAAGVVGSAVVESLRFDPDKRVDAVVCIDRYRPAAVQPHVEWREVDWGRDDLAVHFQGVNALVNVAWARSGRSGGGNVAAIRRVLEAAAAAGVRHIVQASSFAAYAPAPSRHDPVNETWPIEGLTNGAFAQELVALERWLDEFAAAHAVVRVARIRAGVPLGPRAVAQFRQRLGPVAATLKTPQHLPFLPGFDGAALPAVHHDDLADAYRQVVTGTGHGPYNIALDTPLGLAAAAAALGARPLAVPDGLVARGADLAERLLGGRGTGGWLSLVRAAPRLDTTRARHDLGWAPVHTLDEALRTTLAGG